MLEGVIAELEPAASGQLGLDGKPVPPAPLSVSMRTALVDLGVKLERSLAGELGTEDPDPTDDGSSTTPPASTRRAAFGPRTRRNA
jgi:hypothetical protein